MLGEDCMGWLRGDVGREGLLSEEEREEGRDWLESEEGMEELLWEDWSEGLLREDWSEGLRREAWRLGLLSEDCRDGLLRELCIGEVSPVGTKKKRHHRYPRNCPTPQVLLPGLGQAGAPRLPRVGWKVTEATKTMETETETHTPQEWDWRQHRMLRLGKRKAPGQEWGGRWAPHRDRQPIPLQDLLMLSDPAALPTPLPGCGASIPVCDHLERPISATASSRMPAGGFPISPSPTEHSPQAAPCHRGLSLGSPCWPRASWWLVQPPWHISPSVPLPAGSSRMGSALTWRVVARPQSHAAADAQVRHGVGQVAGAVAPTQAGVGGLVRVKGRGQRGGEVQVGEVRKGAARVEG